MPGGVLRCPIYTPSIPRGCRLGILPFCLPAPVLRSFFCELRAALRLTCVISLVVSGVCVVCMLFPFLSASIRRDTKQRWSRLLVWTLGAKITSAAHTSLPAGGFLVCNHISWLDVFVLNALAPTTFVCKDDVKSWPLIGTLVKHSETLFIERGSRSAAARTSQAIAQRLQLGERVAVFPEGTTTQGLTLLPFRAALFQAANDAHVPVLPATLRYLTPEGNICLTPAYDGEISFAESMLAIVRTPRFIASVQFLEPLPQDLGRRELSQKAESCIAEALGFPARTGCPAEIADTNNISSEMVNEA
jgi:1-acyl-sn-glycerol-3-phosphate acyltransferase